MWRAFGIAVTIAFLVALGVGLGYFGTRTTVKPVPTPTPPATTPVEETVGVSPVWPTNTRPARTASVPVATNAAAPITVAPIVTNAPLSGIITNWEDKVDEILAADIEDDAKGKKMLELFPHVPAEGQQEVAQHLANLVPDEAYAPLGQVLVDPTSGEDVQDVLIGDLLNRPNSTKLPLLLDVARNPQHPKAAEARDILELFLEEDYGNDWNRWQGAMQKWLQENPD